MKCSSHLVLVEYELNNHHPPHRTPSTHQDRTMALAKEYNSNRTRLRNSFDITYKASDAPKHNSSHFPSSAPIPQILHFVVYIRQRWIFPITRAGHTRAHRHTNTCLASLFCELIYSNDSFSAKAYPTKPLIPNSWTITGWWRKCVRVNIVYRERSTRRRRPHKWRRNFLATIQM